VPEAPALALAAADLEELTPEPGSLAARLVYGPGETLIALDPVTGERRRLLGRRR
jgi:hypothetical protein